MSATRNEAAIGVGRSIGGGRYKVVGQIDSGGMGSVFAVEDIRRGYRIALKTLASKDPEQLYRIKREFRTLQPIEHQNLVHLYDLVIDGPEPFFTMELLEGWHLDDYLADGNRVRWNRLSPTLYQLSNALQVIHDKKLIHRDLKPGNVIVVRGGRLVLLDFGFAISQEADELKTRDIAGTPIFMAPEQMDGDAVPASDWYSVGMILRRIYRDSSNQDEAPEGFMELVRSLSDPDFTRRGGLTEVRGFEPPGR